jgi:acetyl-CoA carboxylase biotin carboxyl carrier protein
MFDASTWDLLTLKMPGMTVELRRGAGIRSATADAGVRAATADAATADVTTADATTGDAATADATTPVTIDAPVLGVIRLGPVSSAAPFVSVGASVQAGDVVACLQVLDEVHEVAATHSGVVTEILAADGDLIEYQQPLFAVDS